MRGRARDSAGAAWRRELGSLARIAAPVVLVQVSLVTMGFIDTLMVGHVSKEALAGVALGETFSFTLHAFALGTLLALDPLVSQAHGAGDEQGVSRAIARGLVLAGVLTVPVGLLLLLAHPVLVLTHQPIEAIPLAASYSTITIIGLPGFLAFVVLRQALQAMHRLEHVVAVAIGANVVNALLDAGLLYGWFGMPKVGPIAVAWATTSCRLLMPVALALLAWRDFARLPRPVAREAFDLRALLRLLRLGTPIGLQYLLEIGCFSAVAFFMGLLGTTEVAAHQIAIRLASLAFMLPMGMSQAASVRVGWAVGREDLDGMRLAGRVALVAGAVVMLGSASVFLCIPRLLAAMFTHDEPVLALAATLIGIAGIFQVFDGLQVVAIGVLRGLGDTRAPMIANVVGFLLLGTPVGAWLAFDRGLGAVGLWWGLVLGLAVVAAVLMVRARHRLAGVVTRLEH